MLRLLPVALLITAGLLAGCIDNVNTPPGAGDEDAPPAPSTAPRANVIAGRVVDERGNGVASASLLVQGNAYTGAGWVEFTRGVEPDGRFSYKVPEGTYRVTGWVEVEYAGEFFKLDLYPVDGEIQKSLESENGIVKDFEWRLAGLVPGGAADPGNPRTHYGSYIQVSDERWYLGEVDPYGEREATPFPDGSVTVVTLVPDGPLVDGSDGETLTRTTTWPFGSWEDRLLLDIPIGRYTASAVVEEPDGTKTPLRVASRPYDTDNDPRPMSEPGASAPIEFRAWSSYGNPHYVDIYLMY